MGRRTDEINKRSVILSKNTLILLAIGGGVVVVWWLTRK